MAEEALPKYRREPSSLNRTEAALMGRQVDSATAHRLREGGWTVRALQQQSRDALAALGLTVESIAALRASGRPDIPSANLRQVLAASRFTCCVCHDPTKPIIVHHIRPWAESADHNPDNLALLCLEHHEHAHRVSTLTRNLDAALLADLKQDWEAQVRLTNTQAILEASRLSYDAWWYFNHRRLFEIATAVRVPLRDLARSHGMEGTGLVTDVGTLRARPSDTHYMYSGLAGMELYDFVRAVMNAVLDRITIYNVSDHLDRGWLGAILKPSNFVFVQGAHTFASRSKRSTGPDQPKTGVRKTNHVEIRFSFDGWEATSNSAWGVWLRGRRNAGSIVRVVTLGRQPGTLVIEGTVIGIGAAFHGLKEREYLRGVLLSDDEEEDEEESAS